MICNKKKLDKIEALMIIYNAQVKNKKKFHKRQEKRLYWCEKCLSYHVTSKSNC